MNAALRDASLLVVSAALLASGAALLATGRVVVALPVLLDLLLAASLLRLVSQPTLLQLAGTGLLLAVKRLASIGVRTAAMARTVAVGRPGG